MTYRTICDVCRDDAVIHVDVNRGSVDGHSFDFCEYHIRGVHLGLKGGWWLDRECSPLPAKERANESEYMCPNCVTPWKCNGPHESAALRSEA